MILNTKVTSLLLIVLFTYMNVPFYFVGITALQKAFYYGISLLPVFFALYRGISSKKNLFDYVKLFLIYFITIFVVMIVSGALNFDYCAYFIRLLIGVFASISMFCIWHFEKSIEAITEDFLVFYLKSVALYIFGTFVFICVPSLKEFWQSIIMDYQTVEFTDFLEYVTRFGFAGFSGFTCAFMVSAASILMGELYLEGTISLRQCKFYSVVFTVGSFFYGRIGFVVSIFSCGMLSLYMVFHDRRQLFRFYILLVLILIGIGFVLYFFIPDIQPFIDWLLEPLFNYFDNGKLESASTDGLGRMYKKFHPSDKTLAFGDGYWLDLNGKGYYGHTDVGFMRNIYYGGIFYTGLLYSLIVFLLLLVYWNLKARKVKSSFFIVFLMAVQFILFEMKGDITFTFLKAYIPFYLYLLYEKKEKNVSTKRFPTSTNKASDNKSSRGICNV